MLGIHALHASLSLIEDEGIDTIAQNVLRNSEQIIELVSATKGFELLTNPLPERRSGIVTFKHRKYSPGRINSYLKSNGVLAAQRGGGVRFSPHFYNTADELGEVWEITRRIRS